MAVDGKSNQYSNQEKKSILGRKECLMSNRSSKIKIKVGGVDFIIKVYLMTLTRVVLVGDGGKSHIGALGDEREFRK